MNERIEHCLYQAGLTAQGCWDELDSYAQEGIERFAELVVQECLLALDNTDCRHAHTTYDRSVVEFTVHKCRQAIVDRFDIKNSY